MAEPLQLKNPFDLGVVLGFGAILTVVMMLAKALTLWTGTTTVMALAAASGIADVDAITLSMARLGRADLAARNGSPGNSPRSRRQLRVEGRAGDDDGRPHLWGHAGGGTAFAIAAGLATLWLAANWDPWTRLV